MSLAEIDEASQVINAAADEDANIIFGTVIDDSMGDQIRVTVIATGFDGTSTQPSMDLGGSSAPRAARRAPAPAPSNDSNYGGLFDDDIPDFLKRDRY